MQKQINVAINGFGRIGKCAARVILEKHKNLNIVLINDLRADDEGVIYSLKHDSAFGKFEMDKISANDGILTVEKGGKTSRIKLTHEADPKNLPYKNLDVDVVLECTGVFRDSKSAQAHIDGGAKFVIISAPAKDDNISTIVQGVNDEEAFKIMNENNNKMISNASCTTNCISPLIKMMMDKYDVEFINGITVHAYTQSQMLQDGINSKGLRDGRAAAENLVPSTTGASKAVGMVLPDAKKIISLTSVRAPVKTGSMVYVNFKLKDDVTAEEVNKYLENETKNYQGIVEFSKEELVSTDIIANTNSTIIDSLLTEVKEKNVTLTIWYDNEWGYANRLVELVEKVVKEAK